MNIQFGMEHGQYSNIYEGHDIWRINNARHRIFGKCALSSWRKKMWEAKQINKLYFLDKLISSKLMVNT